MLHWESKANVEGAEIISLLCGRKHEVCRSQEDPVLVAADRLRSSRLKRTTMRWLFMNHACLVNFIALHILSHEGCVDKKMFRYWGHFFIWFLYWFRQSFFTREIFRWTKVTTTYDVFLVWRNNSRDCFNSVKARVSVTTKNVLLRVGDCIVGPLSLAHTPYRAMRMASAVREARAFVDSCSRDCIWGGYARLIQSGRNYWHDEGHTSSCRTPPPFLSTKTGHRQTR